MLSGTFSSQWLSGGICGDGGQQALFDLRLCHRPGDLRLAGSIPLLSLLRTMLAAGMLRLSCTVAAMVSLVEVCTGHSWALSNRAECVAF